MSRVKNISGGALYVSLLGRIVEDGEVVEIPDRQDGGDPEDPAMAIIVPTTDPDRPSRWEAVTGKEAKAAAAAAAPADPREPAAADDTGKAM